MFGGASRERMREKEEGVVDGVRRIWAKITRRQGDMKRGATGGDR
jgi:hypothetical protein